MNKDTFMVKLRLGALTAAEEAGDNLWLFILHHAAGDCSLPDSRWCGTSTSITRAQDGPPRRDSRKRPRFPPASPFSNAQLGVLSDFPSSSHNDGILTAESHRGMCKQKGVGVGQIRPPDPLVSKKLPESHLWRCSPIGIVSKRETNGNQSHQISGHQRKSAATDGLPRSFTAKACSALMQREQPVMRRECITLLDPDSRYSCADSRLIHGQRFPLTYISACPADLSKAIGLQPAYYFHSP